MFNTPPPVVEHVALDGVGGKEVGEREGGRSSMHISKEAVAVHHWVMPPLGRYNRGWTTCHISTHDSVRVGVYGQVLSAANGCYVNTYFLRTRDLMLLLLACRMHSSSAHASPCVLDPLTPTNCSGMKAV